MSTIEIMDCGEVSCEYCSKDKCIYMTNKIDVLNKIRKEIIENAKGTMNDTRAEGLYMALNIVDKYRNEVSE